VKKNTAKEISLEKYSKMDDYSMLVKTKLSLFVVFSSILAYIAVAQSNIDYTILILLGVGGFCITGAANTLNQILERDYDKLMTRTQNRPLATGRMKLSEASLFSGLLLMTGSILLALINPLTALLSMMSLVLYAFVYTPLKRYSTLAVAVGALPGALPVLIGTSAFSGTITLIGVTLFAIQFLWQFPHFWSIGWLSFEDYKKAGYKLLPVDELGAIDKKLGLHAFIYAVILVPVSIYPFFIGELNFYIALAVGIVGILYAIASLYFYIEQNRKAALRLMFSSFIYLPVVLILYLI